MQWDSYEHLHDPVIRQLLPKIRSEHSAAMEVEFPVNMSGTLTIRARGKTFVKTVIVPTGEPGNFLSEARLLQKFTDLTEPALGGERAARLASALLQVDHLDNAAILLELGQPANR
jgi:2-methylcitrate dehydratase PrpD